jgi:hypothetical protein
MLFKFLCLEIKSEKIRAYSPIYPSVLKINTLEILTKNYFSFSISMTGPSICFGSWTFEILAKVSLKRAPSPSNTGPTTTASP